MREPGSWHTLLHEMSLGYCRNRVVFGKMNKVNVFMGPQSCGKSTIAKIISYCSWFEKATLLRGISSRKFYKELVEFHDLEDAYFSDDSYIEYENGGFHIIFRGAEKEKPEVVLPQPGSSPKFMNRKIEYIPAERNFVALKGLAKYNETRDNILNFLYDWFEAKVERNKDSSWPLPVRSLGVSFFYDSEKDSDFVRLEDGKELALRHSSSGLMSVTPLLLVFDYVMETVYRKERIPSPEEHLFLKEQWKNGTDTSLSDRAVVSRNISKLKKLQSIQEEDWELRRLLKVSTDYAYSEIIVEEPELSLFPQTQRDLVYYMLQCLNESGRPDQLVLTTHSPYILFSLNNCMMGGLVKDKVPESKRNGFLSSKSWVDPRSVSIYEIHDGCLRTIQDEDGIIEDNYLNQAYKENTSEYLSLLDYCEDGGEN